MQPQQTIKTTLEEIIEKSSIGKKRKTLFDENVNKLANLTTEQKKIISSIQKLITDEKIKKSEIEQLKELLLQYNEKFSTNVVIINDVNKQIAEFELSKMDYENELDKNVKQYNGFSKKRPMENMCYEATRKSYKVTLGTNTHRIANCDMACRKILEETWEKNSDAVGKFFPLGKKSFDYKKRHLIAYYDKDTVLFDIQHILQILDLHKSQSHEKYNEYKNRITHWLPVKNEFGGYFIRELIPMNVLCDLAMSSSSDFSKALRKNIGDIIEKLYHDGQLFVSEKGNLDYVPAIQLPLITNQRRKSIQIERLGYDAKDMLARLGICPTSISCVYLFTVGRVEKLRKEMNIDEKFSDDKYVIKYGLTNDLARRTSEHIKNFSALQGTELKLTTYAPMNNDYLHEAEIEIENFLNVLNSRIKWNGMEELAVLSIPEIDGLKLQYDKNGKIKNWMHADFINLYENKNKALTNENEKLHVSIDNLTEKIKLMENTNVERHNRLEEKIKHLEMLNKNLTELHEVKTELVNHKYMEKINSVTDWFAKTYYQTDSKNRISLNELYSEYKELYQNVTKSDFKNIFKTLGKLSKHITFDEAKKISFLIGYEKIISDAE